MEKHDLLHEFPELQDKIHQLKVTDSHFRKLFEDYHDLVHQIHRINMGTELANEQFAHELKAKLLFRKDELYAYLNK